MFFILGVRGEAPVNCPLPLYLCLHGILGKVLVSYLVQSDTGT